MHWELIDYVGLAGGVLLLFGFWRTSISGWKTTSLWYELDNIIASALLLVYSLQKHAYINIALNIIWGIVAFRGISSYAERKLKHNKAFAKAYRKAHSKRP